MKTKINLTKAPDSYHEVVTVKREAIDADSPLNRHFTNDRPPVVHAVAQIRNTKPQPVPAPSSEWQYVAFDDERGGLRHLTEAEAQDLAATRNTDLGWAPDNGVCVAYETLTLA